MTKIVIKSLVKSMTCLGLAFIILVMTMSQSSAAVLGCATPTAPTAATAQTVGAKAYQTWKQAYVVRVSDNQLRVQRSAGDKYDTVSEGIAYGMLFASYGNDKSTFDGLWQYAQAHVNTNGLMNWRISADGSTTGFNGATDADEDMATALIAADTQWGGYKTDAQKQINLIKKYEIEPTTNVLKPGDYWGGSTLLNPSYISPGYYSVFAQYMNDNSWNDVKAANYRVLENIHANTDSRLTGYIPDWSTANGTAAQGMSYNYGYDASRAPLRLALASAWDCDTTANTLLGSLNTTNQTLSLNSLANTYYLNGVVASPGDGTALLSAAAAAATSSDNATLRAATWTSLLDTASTSYFSDSMRLLGLFIAGGIFTNPLQLTPKTPILSVALPPVAPQIFSLTGSAVTGVSGTAITSTVLVSAPQITTGVIVDLEVYDSYGSRVAQKFYPNQTLLPTPTSYTVNFTPTSAGIYTVRGGIFANNWSNSLTWNGAITTANVTSTPSSATSTPPVTATTVATPPPVMSAPVTIQPSTINPQTTASLTVATTIVVPSSPSPLVQVIVPNISIWWPGDGQTVQGVQPFKAVLDGANIADYTMYWQVDGGTLNALGNSTVDGPHKESLVDVSGWNWNSTNKYAINFVAMNAAGQTISQKSTIVTVGQILVNRY